MDLVNGGPELIVENFEVNAVSPFMLTRAFLPLLRQAAAIKKRTVVANITSKMGSMDDNTSGGHYAYRTSKVIVFEFLHDVAVSFTYNCRRNILARRLR